MDIYGRTISDGQGNVVAGQVPTGGGVFGPVHVISKAFIAADQDTTLFAAATGAPCKFRLLDVFVDISTGNASETLTLRDTTGGAGNALSSAITLAATGRVREAAPTATATIAAGGNVFLRRNTTVGVGRLVVTIQYEA